MHRLIIEGFGLDSPGRAFLVGVGMGLGAVVGFAYSDYIGSEDAQERAIAVQEQSETLSVGNVLDKSGASLAGALGGSCLALGSLTFGEMLTMEQAEQAIPSHTDDRTTS